MQLYTINCYKNGDIITIILNIMRFYIIRIGLLVDVRLDRTGKKVTDIKISRMN